MLPFHHLLYLDGHALMGRERKTGVNPRATDLNLKGHDRGQNDRVNPNKNDHCQAKAVRGISVAFVPEITKQLFTTSKDVNAGRNNEQLDYNEEALQRDGYFGSRMRSHRKH